MKNGWETNTIGTKLHYLNDKNHNDNGPAVIYKNGTKFWFKHGKLHRLDGPAIDAYNGQNSWWYEGKCIGKSIEGYTQDKFDQWFKFKVFE